MYSRDFITLNYETNFSGPTNAFSSARRSDDLLFLSGSGLFLSPSLLSPQVRPSSGQQ